MSHHHHDDHAHTHGPGCGHPAVRHGDHTDYLHDGHLHHACSHGAVEEHELEAGFTRGMMSFERCLNMKMADGWKPTKARATGFTEHEVYDYLSKEQLTNVYAAG